VLLSKLNTVLPSCQIITAWEADFDSKIGCGTAALIDAVMLQMTTSESTAVWQV